MKVLVTGACGNVGAHTVDLLLERGHEVRAVDVERPASRERARPWAGRGADVRWCDVRDPGAVRRAVDGVEHVLHLAAIIPPATDADEELAEAVNVGGTRNVVEACLAQGAPPHLVFCSTAAVWGRNAGAEGPRRADEPLHPEDAYGRQKVRCEETIRGAGLPHTIFRLAVTPPISLASVSPFIFDFHPDTRVEFTHPTDVALALANTTDPERRPAIDGKILLIGGGAANRMTYLDFMNEALGVMGIRALPRDAFGPHRFYTDWLDSDESQALLAYQRHPFATYLGEMRDLIGPARHLIPPVEPLVRAWVLANSRHHAAATGRRPWLLDLQGRLARLRGRGGAAS